jgi:molecular chaperone DnaK
MTKIIERNTTIPVRRSETFSTATDNQPAVDIVVLQGERERAADNRVLGRMRLEDIRPAPRGVPQIEVTYDIDANGILNVSARDRDTNAEQQITITESGTLDTSEVDRLVREAEQHRAEDARLRQRIDARNELDSVAYQVERSLDGAMPEHERARAHVLIAEARQAIKDDAPVEQLRSRTQDLQQILHGRAPTAPTDEVIDAEFTPGS